MVKFLKFSKMDSQITNLSQVWGSSTSPALTQYYSLSKASMCSTSHVFLLPQDTSTHDKGHRMQDAGHRTQDKGHRGDYNGQRTRDKEQMIKGQGTRTDGQGTMDKGKGTKDT